MLKEDVEEDKEGDAEGDKEGDEEGDAVTMTTTDGEYIYSNICNNIL